MPYSPIPPNLSTSQYQQLVLQLLNTIGGPGMLDIQPPILSTSDFRHLVLYALNYLATNGTGAKAFVELEDTPNSYAGAAGYVVQVKGDESGLEFILGGGGGAPSGPAGGDLAGSYPNPTIKSSVDLVGVPTVPTAAADTNTQQIASTAFVLGQAGSANPVMDGAAFVGTSPRYSRQDHVHPSDTSRAPLASPALTGTPTAPTAADGTNTTQIATTQFVQSAIAGGSSLNSKVLIAEVVNADSVTLTRGTVVYAFGSVGNKLSVKRADNTSDATSATTLGFIREASLAAGAQGTVTIYGSMDQLNLGSPFNDGDPIYLGTNGGYQKTKPVAPAHSVFLGIVERANAGNGIAYVKVQNGYELDELHDVLITSELAGQALVRNAGNTLWINKSLAVADISGAAPLASPTFTGVVAAPTVAAGTNNTQIATTAFVQNTIQAITIYGSHRTALSPAIGGQTYYFGYPDDLAAVITATERGFRFPFAGTIVGANLTISVTGTLGAGATTAGAIGIFNKATSAFSTFSFGSLNYTTGMTSYRSSGLSIAVNTTDEYAFSLITPNFTGGTAPTSTRHYVNLFYVR